MASVHGFGLGWHRDLPDIRDSTEETDDVSKILVKSNRVKAAKKKLPKKIDLREWCSPIEDQGSLGSCTAHAGVGMMEYYERRTSGKHLDASRLFLYKVTRQLLGFKGDDGAYLRSTMKAMVLFGVPPEKYWPYKPEKYNDDPDSFCFAFAQSYKSMKYYRLDPSGRTPANILEEVKKSLAAELPAMFGFSVYSSIPAIGEGTGNIPYPKRGDTLEGGHAVLAVGYDDDKKIDGETGALLIRNSWGTRWGDKGYGWLPYKYVLKGLADDFWSLVKADFVDTDLFN